ncbi:hypothetical protein N665_0039s0100 [Sinapis alba]|nr:hypothetical protein N665_0039s0100 [Sinapis alba]
MEKEDFLRSTGHGEEERHEEMRKLVSSHDDSHQEYDHIIRSKLESIRVEMEEAKEENRRLKSSLNRTRKDFEILQTQYNQLMVQHEDSNNKFSPKGHHQDKNEYEDKGNISEREELVLLSLGRRSKSLVPSGSMTNKDEKGKGLLDETGDVEHDKSSDQGLNMGFEYKDLSNPSEKLEIGHSQEKTSLEVSNSNKIPSENSFGFKNDGDDHHEDEEDILPQNLAKKTRVSVRSRCETPTMNDGCQWRKYGQKIAKGNPCPRAYYRCTIAPSCPVRKQVQRCSEDMSILISTYEGTHNHPLPASATAMASATSAAASMLLSSSSSSSSGAADLHGLNFSLSGNSITPKPKSPFLQTTSSSGHPTVTLDLTASSSSQQTFLSMLNRFSAPLSNVSRSNSTYPSTNLNFSNNTNTLMKWGGGSGSEQYRAAYGNIGTHQKSPPYHHMIQRSSSSSLHPTQPNLDHVGIKNITTHQVHSLPAETIKAITTDPSFQSALANALSTIIGGDLKTDNVTRNEAKKSP